MKASLRRSSIRFSTVLVCSVILVLVAAGSCPPAHPEAYPIDTAGSPICLSFLAAQRERPHGSASAVGAAGAPRAWYRRIASTPAP